MDVPQIPKASVAKADEAKKPERVKPVKADAAKVQGEVAADTVSLSPRAKLLQHLRAKYDQLPDVREDKVQDLKKRIEEGAHKLSSEEIVKSILDGGLFQEI